MAARRPVVFIGSSSEGHRVAQGVQQNLDRTAECVVWSQGVFGLSEGTLESLVRALGEYDFAVLVLTPDDLVTSRDQSQQAPRDNVLLELGMFIGAIGRERTFMLVDRAAELKLPSDLAGITPATFELHELGTVQSSVGAACTTFGDEIQRLGRIAGSIHIKGFSSYRVNGKSGIGFRVTNEGSEPIPPYVLRLRHPDAGTWAIFPSEKSGELLPHQQREHYCELFDNWQFQDWYRQLDKDRDGNPLPPERFQRFSMELALEDSDKVLYENHRVARGFVNIVRESSKGDCVTATRSAWQELDSSLPDK